MKHGLSGVGKGLIKIVFVIYIIYFLYIVLCKVNNIRDDISGVLKTNSESSYRSLRS